MKIAVGHTGQFTVGANIDTVFDLLADVPRSVSHFPDLDTLAPLGGNAFRWEMAPIGALGISHRVVYACRYTSDAEAAGVNWTPLEGVGNGIIGGRWRLSETDHGTRVDFVTDGALDVPVPAPLRRAAEPFVQRRFSQQVQRYLDNLKHSLERST